MKCIFLKINCAIVFSLYFLHHHVTCDFMFYCLCNTFYLKLNGFPFQMVFWILAFRWKLIYILRTAPGLPVTITVKCHARKPCLMLLKLAIRMHRKSESCYKIYFNLDYGCIKFEERNPISTHCHIFYQFKFVHVHIYINAHALTKFIYFLLNWFGKSI